MTDDLHTLLRDAADDRAVAEPATGPQLLARARERSRRRRARRMVVGATVVATSAAAAAAVVLGGGPLPGLRSVDEAGPDPDSGVGAYHPIELSLEEALERCAPVLESQGYPPDADWRLASDSEPLHVGAAIVLGRADRGSLTADSDFVGCEVPFTKSERDRHRITEPIADSHDSAGLLRQCGAVAGYDFAGWEVVNAVGAAEGVEAVLRSTNDYVAYCSLEPDWGRAWASRSPSPQSPIQGWTGQTVLLPTRTEAEENEHVQSPVPGSSPFGFGLSCGDTRQIMVDNQLDDGLLCSGSGSLHDVYGVRGHKAMNATVLEVTIRGGGDAFVIPVVDGHFAARFLDPAADRNDDTYDYVVKDESGNVLYRGIGGT
ncbi:hypothetical protein [Nocardioides speluncae]|uniref:hypothetical protein n=1 Tax=Nocardioides speluncae TaxID=2670337 RepID=UPI000D68A7F9|nr:hypothetical protein [Nocardioides speluncae]